MNILIVRLGALGDIVHAIPAAAALRRGVSRRADRLARRREAPRDRRSGHRASIASSPLERPHAAGWRDVVRDAAAGALRRRDRFSGLMKSAVLARASGARAGGRLFDLAPAREERARPFYSRDRVADRRRHAAAHVIRKNLRLLQRARRRRRRRSVSARATCDRRRWRASARRSAPIAVRADQSRRRVAEQALAAGAIRRGRGVSARASAALPSFVLWGPGEEELAAAVVDASGGAARAGAADGIADLLALCARGALMVSGDTGPLHIAAAAGTPTSACSVRPTRSATGRGSADDVVGVAIRSCGCHYERRCHEARGASATIDGRRSVARAVQRRSSSEVANDDRHRCAASRAFRVPLGFVCGVAGALARAPRRARASLIGAVVAASGKRSASGRPAISRRGARSRSPVPIAFTRHPLYVGSTIIGRRVRDRVRTAWSLAVLVRRLSRASR